MVKTAYRISLVLIAQQGETSLLQTISAAHHALASLAAKYEIIVVTEASGVTSSAIRTLADDLRLRIVEHTGKPGYGAALRQGLAAATLDLVAFSDPRCAFDFSNLEYLLGLTNDHEVICGYATNGGGPVRWRLLRAAYNSLIAVLIGSPAQHDCGVKIFRRAQLASLRPTDDNYFASAEMLAEAKLQGIKIAEAGLPQPPVPKAKLGWLGVAGTLIPLVRFWWSRVTFPALSSRGNLASNWYWLAMAVLAWRKEEHSP